MLTLNAVIQTQMTLNAQIIQIRQLSWENTKKLQKLVLLIDYPEKGRTINNKYYIALLVRLKEEINQKIGRNEEKKSAL